MRLRVCWKIKCQFRARIRTNLVAAKQGAGSLWLRSTEQVFVQRGGYSKLDSTALRNCPFSTSRFLADAGVQSGNQLIESLVSVNGCA